VMVADITPGDGSSGPSGLTNVSGTLMFGVRPSGSTFELWKSDGTGDGTVVVKAFSTFSSVFPRIVLGGILYLQIGADFWRSDGTEGGTTLIHPGILPQTPFLACGGDFAAAGTTLVFPGQDANGCEPWKSDGVTAEPLRDLNPGPSNSTWPNHTTPFKAVGELVLFGADDGVNGHELWGTTGDSSNTRLVQNIAEGAGWSAPKFFTPAGRYVFFSAANHLTGVELWAIPKSGLFQRFDVPEESSEATTRSKVTSRRRSSSDEFRAFGPAVEVAEEDGED
jgi:ELWxxDGT repeat protein